MSTLDLVTEVPKEADLGLVKRQNQLLVIQAIRVAFLFAILLIALVFQASQGEFISLEVWLPFYIMLTISFLINSANLIFFNLFDKYWITNATLFAYDALFVTFLIYFTGSSQSIFLFLYLVNIILCGMVFQRRGSFVLALWTSILFSFLLILGPEIKGQNLYFAVGLNNLAFFAVAYLGGLLSEQINFMDVALEARGQDIEALKDLNQMIVDNMGTGLLVANREWKITQVNQAAFKILEEEQLSVKSIRDIFPLLYEHMNKLKYTSGEFTAERREVEYRNFKNEKAILEMVIAPLKGPEKDLRGFIFTFQDLTQIKKMEYQLRQQEKMAAIGQLAAGIAHEIRNPLASISGSAQLLQDNLKSTGADDLKLLRIVIKEIDRLNGLITEFLDFVRPDVRVEDPINLNQLCRDILDSVKVNKKLRQDVLQNVELKSHGVILGHYDKLKQAFLNVIINSYQAMEKTDSPSLKVSTWDNNDFVVVKISDNGVGMDPNNLKRIFEPFHTTKNNGTGLGLAITHKIFENHDARVFVESELGQGTQFVIEFQGSIDPNEGKLAEKVQA